MQDTKDGIFTMKGLALTNLLHNLIREYGTYDDGTYSVDPKTFSSSDKRLVLSHVFTAETYEWSCSNNQRLEAMYMQTIDIVQTLLDSECYQVYCDDMEDMGMTQCRHHDNGEAYWVQR
jgi:hypothetical protein